MIFIYLLKITGNLSLVSTNLNAVFSRVNYLSFIFFVNVQGLAIIIKIDPKLSSVNK